MPRLLVKTSDAIRLAASPSTGWIIDTPRATARRAREIQFSLLTAEDGSLHGRGPGSQHRARAGPGQLHSSCGLVPREVVRVHATHTLAAQGRAQGGDEPGRARDVGAARGGIRHEFCETFWGDAAFSAVLPTFRHG
jgi:hypothetical protein